MGKISTLTIRVHPCEPVATSPIVPGVDKTSIRLATIPAMPLPTQFENVTAVAKANVYFDGGVVSHTILLPDGSRKTLGLIRPGGYRFNTDAAERMQITDGACRVKLDGSNDWTPHAAGTAFDVPAHSGFDIAVDGGLCQYVCSFLS